MTNDVARSVINNIIIVNRTFFKGKTIKNDNTIKLSSKKIDLAVLKPKYLFNILAITAGPPTVLPVDNTIPTLIPIIAPPNTELMTKSSIPKFMSLVSPKNNESAVLEITV